jgi:hypothetical protein
MMTRLPFLKVRRPALERKMAGISKYGFSEDDEVKEQIIEELMHAIQTKDHQGFVTAISALVDLLMSKDGEENAPEALKDASGV